MQTTVLCALEVPYHPLERYHMLIAQVVFVLAESSDGICDIGLSGSDRLHEALDHRLVYGRIAGFFVGFPLGQLHYRWRGNWSGLMHSESSQDRPNGAVLMDVNHVMPPIAFDIHAMIEGETSEIMHPEPLLHLIFHLPNHVLVSNDNEMIDVQINCGNNCALMLIREHEQ